MQQTRPQHQVGVVTWHAAIALGIGDDDTVSGVSESAHDTEQATRDWIDRIM
ncbi:MAG: hypothetical protein ACRDRH_04695 [Pseudonocardia sp.]